MLNDVQIERMLGKLTRLEETMQPYLFATVDHLAVRRHETRERLHDIPPESAGWTAVEGGDTWGGEGMTCWFRGRYTVPQRLAGQDLFLWPELGGYETMLWVDGVPAGIYAAKIIEGSHGNHYCDLLVRAAQAGQSIDVALESYAGHYIVGTQPFETAPRGDFRFACQGVRVCVKNDDVAQFLFDLKAMNQLAQALDPMSFRRAQVINCLVEVHRTVWYSPEDAQESQWRPALAQARQIMAPVLAAHNGPSAPMAGIVGHSHMDTAWLWTIEETVRKCARTYANQMSLMEQYPEYRFVQSSAYHGEVVRRYYPALFERIRSRVAEGRYEPNGGVWVECDCNITSGEMMIRQFLWGQRFTQREFGYTSNSFWLPDTFGYSASIPQIMKGCRVDYFLTTKIGWNDTNRFPYETFWWKGIDGTAVFTHFNTIHCWPDPRKLIEALEGRQGDNYVRQKRVANRRLISYGYGDGGGGPQFEMIEMARRVRDLEGCPKAEHTGVGDFMRTLEREAVDPPAYQGELYLELHRGTLTNQHDIKRNNRKAEQALHDLEVLTVAQAAASGAVAADAHIRPLMETLLVNQFHDILPGTCIQEANAQSVRETEQLLLRAGELIAQCTPTDGDGKAFTVYNTLGFARRDVVYLEAADGLIPADGSLAYQVVEGLDGQRRLAISGVVLPALGSAVIELQPGTAQQPSAFRYEGNVLETPFATVTFADNGTIASFVDKRAQRQIVGSGLPLNTLLMAEDVPTSYDNWDVDADYQLKLQPASQLVERRVIGGGSVEFRIRSMYRISPKSTVTQDMIFYASSPRVDFDTLIDWQDKHRFLKAGFDTTILSATARHEIQFGYCQKPTTRNNTLEQAMFEVLNHKYTDLSETRFGVAVLNDCKYGVSVEGGDIRLSLHKGGARPDERGDSGLHRCLYALLPHEGGFGAAQVVQPAYALNYAPIVRAGRGSLTSLAAVDADNVVIEAIKPCEDNRKAFVLRLYEAEGTYTHAQLRLGVQPVAVAFANMLEEPQQQLPCAAQVSLEFRPFEIKTLVVAYGK